MFVLLFAKKKKLNKMLALMKYERILREPRPSY